MTPSRTLALSIVAILLAGCTKTISHPVAAYYPGATAPTTQPVTILDRYTSSFHWTETNFGAIWLRPQWYLYTNSVLTDVQNGGLSLVTGGGYTRSDTINGHWALARKSVFIGSTQTEEENPYTSNAGPFNKKTYELDGFKCDNSIAKINYCLSKDQGISIPLSAFGLSQRLFSSLLFGHVAR